MSYIGTKPFDQTAKTSTVATANGTQTTFYPDGGYLLGFVDVYDNGVKLAPNVDYTATDGVGVVLATAPASNSAVEMVAYWATSLTDAVTTTVPAGGTIVVRDVIPFANNTYNVGNTTNRFANLFLSANGVNIGNAVISSNSTHVSFSYPNGSPIAIAANLTFNSNVTFGGTTTTKALVPDANVTYDLGTALKRYKDLYLANSTIYLGNSSLSESGGAIRITKRSWWCTNTCNKQRRHHSIH